jgi:hypothetical protein
MNHTTRMIVTTIGIILAIAGLDHGIFEILQGNTPTGGLIIQAIGPGHQMWHYGTEEAFTIIPNFLLTGIAAVMVSLAIIIWSIGFVHTKHGTSVLGVLFILLFLVGGGIAAQIIFAPVTWAAATRIHKPLNGWLKILPENIRRRIAKLWRYTLAIGCLSFLVGLFIAITGYVPGQNDPETILNICWAFIFIGGLGMYLLTFVCGFAHDSQQQIHALIQGHDSKVIFSKEIEQ